MHKTLYLNDAATYAQQVKVVQNRPKLEISPSSSWIATPKERMDAGMHPSSYVAINDQDQVGSTVDQSKSGNLQSSSIHVSGINHSSVPRFETDMSCSRHGSPERLQSLISDALKSKAA